MNKLFTLLIVLSLFSFSQTFDVTISLAKHPPSEYGFWKLTKVTPQTLESHYKSKIIEADKSDPYNRATPYYIEQTDIEVFQKQLFTKNVLLQGYYNLEWIKYKNTIGDEIWDVSNMTKKMLKKSNFFKHYTAQDGWEEIDWSMVLADYINHTIKNIPSYELNITNQGDNNIKIVEFYAKTIFTTGGEASTGGAYLDTQSKENLFILDWNKEKILKLKEPYNLLIKQSKTVPLNIQVTNGSQGDGPGQLGIGLFVKFIEKDKVKEELLAIMKQSEDYGYLTGW